MHSTNLTTRSLFALSGDDVIPFLQGLITNDANLLMKGEALYTALLSPQGKFLHDFFLIPQEDRILLDVHADRAVDLLSRLRVYKLRSKVDITPLSDVGVVATWDGGEAGIIDPRLAALGRRIYGDVKQTPQNASEADYNAHRITLAVPDGAIDLTFDTSLIMEYGFEDLNAVNFTKGCYVGQEVTARMKHRAAIRRHLVRVESGDALPAHSTIIVQNEQIVGELLSVSENVGLAHVKLDALAKNDALVCEGKELSARFPEWLTHIPKSAE